MPPLPPPTVTGGTPLISETGTHSSHARMDTRPSYGHGDAREIVPSSLPAWLPAAWASALPCLPAGNLAIVVP